MFGKIFQQVFESTVNELDLHVRFVWFCFLVICDRDGIVDATPESIARRINLPVVQVNDAIGELCKPDERSRSSEEDGRRLIPIRSTYGWQIVNYAKYRVMNREEDRRDYMRDYQRDYMRKRRAASKPVRHQLDNNKQPLAGLTNSRGRGRGNKQESLSSDVRRTTPKIFPKESIEVELSELLFSLIQRRNPNHKPPDLQRWARHVDLMIQRDHRDPADIRRIIEWSQADEFWKVNIRSTEKLREQFDQLVEKSEVSRRRETFPVLVPLGGQR